MYYVYFIKSIIKNFHYIGSTPNIENRLKEHNFGKVKSTKNYAPFELIYYEAYKEKDDAIIREQKLKDYGSSYGHLKKRLKKSLSND